MPSRKLIDWPINHLSLTKGTLTLTGNILTNTLLIMQARETLYLIETNVRFDKVALRIEYILSSINCPFWAVLREGSGHSSLFNRFQSSYSERASIFSLQLRSFPVLHLIRSVALHNATKNGWKPCSVSMESARKKGFSVSTPYWEDLSNPTVTASYVDIRTC